MTTVKIIEKCEDNVFSKGHPKVCNKRLLKRCKKEGFAKRNPEKCLYTLETIVTNENSEDTEVDNESEEGEENEEVEADILEVEVVKDAGEDKNGRNAEINKKDRGDVKKHELVKKCKKKRYFGQNKEICKKINVNAEEDVKLNYDQVALCADIRFRSIKKCQIILTKVNKECSKILYRAVHFIMCSKFGNTIKEEVEEVTNTKKPMVDHEEEEVKFDRKMVHKCHRKKMSKNADCKKIKENFKAHCSELQFRTHNFSLCMKYHPQFLNNLEGTETILEKIKNDGKHKNKKVKVKNTKDNENNETKEDSDNDEMNKNDDIENVVSEATPAAENNNKNKKDDKDPNWLTENCKKLKFRTKNKNLCKDLCVRKNYAKRFTDVCGVDTKTIETTATDGDETTTVAGEELVEDTEDKQTIITDVINDIVSIVMEENKAAQEIEVATTEGVKESTTVASTTSSTTTTTTTTTTTESTTSTAAPSTTTTTESTTVTTTEATTAPSTTAATTTKAEVSTAGSTDPPADTTPAA